MTTFVYNPNPRDDGAISDSGKLRVEAVCWDGSEIIGGAPDWLPAPDGHLDISAMIDTSQAGDVLFVAIGGEITRALAGWWLVNAPGQGITVCNPEVFARFYRETE